MRVCGIEGVPDYELTVLRKKSSRWCLLIPVINEGERIQAELCKARDEGVCNMVDVIVCDGGSTDGSVEPTFLESMGVHALITKLGPGKQGAQLRTGIHYALCCGYDGVLTVDGNNKDSIWCVPLFIEKLLEGYGYVQGSRFVAGGRAINTPLVRLIAARLVHAPLSSMAAHAHYTDTTNAFRAYSATYLKDPRVQPLRDCFEGYELLAYLCIRASQVGYRTCEVPVERAYPARGTTPTKISSFRGNANLMGVLLKACAGRYDPQGETRE